MRALQLIEPLGPVRLKDVPDPAPGPGEVTVRVEAAGICHSDAHYRSGNPTPPSLPLTLGHEVAGVITRAGPGVSEARVAERVAIHYVISCTRCRACARGAEQFCEAYAMLGMTRDGGWADQLVVPARNAVPVPERVTLEHAAIMMCSSATSLHALRRGRLHPGERVAVFGAGGLGMSAVQLAYLLGAAEVFAVDLSEERLALAAELGAVPVHAGADAPDRIVDSGGADVALDLVGSDGVLAAALGSLAKHGRAVSVGIARRPMELSPYRHLIGPEAELIGSNDHLLAEVYELLGYAAAGSLRLDRVVTSRVPLEAAAVNAALDVLDGYGPGIRTVIVP
jgi:propanol-preferring alcohol dehydrogenase